RRSDGYRSRAFRCSRPCRLPSSEASVFLSKHRVFIKITGLGNGLVPKLDVQGVGVSEIPNLHGLNPRSKNALGCLLWQFGVEHLLARVGIGHRNSPPVAPCRLQFKQRIARLLIANPKGKLAWMLERPDNSIPSKIRKRGGESAVRVQLDRSDPPRAEGAVRQT